MKITSLTESALGTNPKIDKENGILHRVKIIGRESRNGRTYTDRALREAAALYEGRAVNLNHPGKTQAGVDRAFGDGIGWFRGVTHESDGCYGDLHYLKSHAQAPVLVEAAERNPNRFGLSHNAEGNMVKRDGRNYVESIDKVHSVDLVQNPATNTGLFESEDPDAQNTGETVSLKEWISGIDEKHALKARLTAMLEADGMAAYSERPMPQQGQPGQMGMQRQAAPQQGNQNVTNDVQVQPGGQGNAMDDKAKLAFRTLILSVLDDESLAVPAKAAKITAILKFEEKTMAGGNIDPNAGEGKAGADGAGAGAGADKGAAPDKAAADKKAAFEAVEKQKLDTATEILEAAGIKHVPAQVKALASLTESADRKALVETWKSTEAAPGKTQKPAKSAPLTEATAGEFPKDNNAFLKAIGATPVKK